MVAGRKQSRLGSSAAACPDGASLLCVPDQAPLDASSFMLASAEWPPPDQTTKQGRYLAGMLADLQNDNFLVGVRVRTKEARPLPSCDLWTLKGFPSRVD